MSQEKSEGKKRWQTICSLFYHIKYRKFLGLFFLFAGFRIPEGGWQIWCAKKLSMALWQLSWEAKEMLYIVICTDATMLSRPQRRMEDRAEQHVSGRYTTKYIALHFDGIPFYSVFGAYHRTEFLFCCLSLTCFIFKTFSAICLGPFRNGLGHTYGIA